MLLGLLPWEKWLPPYVYGPLACATSLYMLFFSDPVVWWKVVVFVPVLLWGSWGTWTWFQTGRNVFVMGPVSKSKDSQPAPQSNDETQNN